MTKNKVKFTRTLTLSSKISITNEITETYFQLNDSTNKVEYTPYYKELVELLAYIDYFTTGIGFDKDETRYDSVLADKRLMARYKRFRLFNKAFKEVLKDVDKMVEFRKLQLANTSSLDSLFEEVTKIISTMGETFNFKDLQSILPELAKLGKTGINQDDLVNLIIKNQPQGFKKPSKSKSDNSNLEIVKDVETIETDVDEFKEV